MTPLPFRSATELAAAIRAGEISSTELPECYLGRIEALNPGLGAVVTVDTDRARRPDHGPPADYCPSPQIAHLSGGPDATTTGRGCSASRRCRSPARPVHGDR